MGNLTLMTVRWGAPLSGFTNPLETENCASKNATGLCPDKKINGKTQLQLRSEFAQPFVDKIAKFAQDYSKDVTILYAGGELTEQVRIVQSGHLIIKVAMIYFSKRHFRTALPRPII